MVRMPTTEEISACQEAFVSNYSMLRKFYCILYGLSLYLEQFGDVVIQNMFCNGWIHDNYFGNVFKFAPNGIVISFAINAPGTIHDNTWFRQCSVEWRLQKLKILFDQHGEHCVVDSAFSKGNYAFLVKSSQNYMVGKKETAESL